MTKTWRLLLLMAGTFVFAVLALVLANSQEHSGMAGMDHSRMSMPENSADPQEMNPTMQSMSTKHMDMGPHMKMTELRPAKPGDQERADKIVAELLRRSPSTRITAPPSTTVIRSSCPAFPRQRMR